MRAAFVAISAGATVALAAAITERSNNTLSYRCYQPLKSGQSSYGGEFPEECPRVRTTTMITREESPYTPRANISVLTAAEEYQSVPLSVWAKPDEDFTLLNSHLGETEHELFWRIADATLIPEHNDSLGSHMPLEFLPSDAPFGQKEGLVALPTGLHTRIDNGLNESCITQTVQHGADSACGSEGRVFRTPVPTAAAAEQSVGSAQAAGEGPRHAVLPSAPLRLAQLLDPTRFGPAAQYAQYLSTFTPPAQQQQQLQALQQAIASGVGGGNPLALKRLQRRAQAAAYANSVTSHPLLQGVIRTAITTVADALGSVTLAEVVQGAVGGGRMLPIPPIV